MKNRVLEGYQVGLAHFAYVVDNLDAMIERLQKAGFSIAKDGADEPYRKNIYFVDPAGFEVEFVEYLTDVPELRNS
jgi:catechol 2,3-dioxygenase-like lactoylglutathione lyase family enzyme